MSPSLRALALLSVSIVYVVFAILMVIISAREKIYRLHNHAELRISRSIRLWYIVTVIMLCLLAYSASSSPGHLSIPTWICLGAMVLLVLLGGAMLFGYRVYIQLDAVVVEQLVFSERTIKIAAIAGASIVHGRVVIALRDRSTVNLMQGVAGAEEFVTMLEEVLARGSG